MSFLIVVSQTRQTKAQNDLDTTEMVILAKLSGVNSSLEVLDFPSQAACFPSEVFFAANFSSNLIKLWSSIALIKAISFQIQI